MSSTQSNSDQKANSPSSDEAKAHRGWLEKAIDDRGIFSSFLSFPKDKAPWFVTILLIAIAYYLSFWIRLEWIDFAQANYENEKEIVYFHGDGKGWGRYQIPMTVSILVVFYKKHTWECMRITTLFQCSKKWYDHDVTLLVTPNLS